MFCTLCSVFKVCWILVNVFALYVVIYIVLVLTLSCDLRLLVINLGLGCFCVCCIGVLFRLLFVWFVIVACGFGGFVFCFVRCC